MHDPAVRAPTPAPHYDRLLTGCERRQRVRCWRPGGSGDWLLVHTLAGHANVALRDGELVVGPGEAVLYRPGAPQDFRREVASETWEIAWAHFLAPPPWQELLDWPELAPGVLHMPTPKPSLRARIEDCLLAADRLAASGLPQAHRLALNALEAAFLWWDLHNPARRRLDPRVGEAVEYLSRNLHRRVPLDELARVAHLSSSRFADLFKRETGATPRAYAELQRLERAKQLLERTSLPVYEVARQTGFESQFYFATRFRKLTGRTPSELRGASRYG